jgi:hypothetical protein
MSQPQGDTDFFISYRGACTDWALWVNWVVRKAGFSTVLMDEFPVGTNWTDQMRDACDRCHRLIPLYSEDYWDSGACRLEFDTYLAQHVKNAKARFLLPLVVQECKVHDMEGTLLRKPLHTLNRDFAHAAILKVFEGITPVSTVAVAFTDPEPPFPGIASTPSVVIDWPDAVPALKWPLANHDDARAAFASLVTCTPQHKLIAIKGASETGKSHLTRQFFNNAQLRLPPGCYSGRFDFKGTTNLDESLIEFVQHLEIPLPSDTLGLSDRFRAVLATLVQRRAPTLLIFDTYEDAGDADRWVRESLLTSLHRHDWLRIVIAGQTVPTCHGQPWEEAAIVLTLNPPSPQDWHNYAVQNQRSISLTTLTEVHRNCCGRWSMLDTLCGHQH